MALVGLDEGLKDLGYLPLEGDIVGQDDLGAEALEAHVPEIERKKWLIFFDERNKTCKD